MNSKVKSILLSLIILVTTFSLFGCSVEPVDIDDANNASPISNNACLNDEEVILEICKSINSIIENKKFEELAQYVHPKKGVRFSQFGFINTDINLVLMPSQIKETTVDRTIYTWGVYAGSGDPIELTISEYFKKFIYIADFLQADEIGYNKNITSSGYPDDLPEIYPNTNTVEFYFPGTNPQYEGLDWKSIKYVFSQYDGNWFVVGIIENQW